MFKNYFETYPCALPDKEIIRKGKVVNLREALHDDWLWPFNKIPRAWNARGPRCMKDTLGYLPWPPKLVRGKGIARWENAFAQSILFIPSLADKEINESIYGKTVRAYESRDGHPNYGQEILIKLEWREDIPKSYIDTDGRMKYKFDETLYSPSALQKYSPSGYMKLNPDYNSQWKIIKKREFPLDPDTGEDLVLFRRGGKYRPDHFDVYYNMNRDPFPHMGLHWE